MGLTHGLVDVNRTGLVKFWARARLHDKVKDIISNAGATGKFTRGTGTATSWGIHGRVGYEILMAITARQDEATAAMAPDIEACFEVIETLMRFEPKREFSVFLCSNIDFWQHQTLLSKLTTLDLVASTSSFSSHTDPKFVSVLWRPIAMSFKPSSHQQRHTLHSSNFRWCCTPSLSVLTFFATVKASGFGQYGLFALRAQGCWASPTIFFHLPFVAVILTFEFL